MHSLNITEINPVRLVLDNGADESDTPSLVLHDHGATFISPWQFPALAEIQITVSRYAGKSRSPELHGIVIESAPCAPHRYETTVYFPELANATSEDILSMPMLQQSA